MNLIKIMTSIAIVTALAISNQSFAKDGEDTKKTINSSWLSLSKKELEAVEAYAQDYNQYIYKSPTELTFVTETIKRIENLTIP